MTMSSSEFSGEQGWQERVASQFPLLQSPRAQKGFGSAEHPSRLAYLDTAATSQKPQVVIQAEQAFYSSINAGVHRGTHRLAVEATQAYETARARIATFVNASSEEGQEEIVFTSGATAGLNELATSIGWASLPAALSDVDVQARARFGLHEGDEILTSIAEHHSVLLPFQQLARRTGATLTIADVEDDGRLDAQKVCDKITPHTKIVALTAASNVTGALTPLKAIVQKAHQVGALVIADFCQAAPHLRLDVADLDVDFACWSAHKMYGPTGVGFLYGKRELLELLPPANFGGEMVDLAWLDKQAQWSVAPFKFEAGTQPVAQVVAAGVAAQWLTSVGFDALQAHEREIGTALLKVADIPGIRVLGPLDMNERLATVSFEVEGVHPHDVGQFLDSYGVAIRTGHHCAQPIHRRFGVYSSNRASAGVYTTAEDVEQFMDAVAQIRPYFLGK